MIPFQKFFPMNTANTIKFAQAQIAGASHRSLGIEAPAHQRAMKAAQRVEVVDRVASGYAPVKNAGGVELRRPHPKVKGKASRKAAKKSRRAVRHAV